MPRLLIVEDDDGIRSLFEAVLHDQGFEIESIADGKTALDSIAAKPPDILLTDFVLPRADGLEVCRAFQQATGREMVPALIATGSHVDGRRLTEALQIPGVMIVPKPVKITGLAALLHALSEHWSEDGSSTSAAAAEQVADPERTLPGEDLTTTDSGEAQRWVTTYTNLVNFKQFMLDHTRRLIRDSDYETGIELKEIDLPFLQAEQRRLKAREMLWQQRLGELRRSA